MHTVPHHHPDGAKRLIVIGASTGGPHALSYLLPQIRADIRAGILIVQHMPEDFTTMFAKHLNELCNLRVREARNGHPILSGEVLIAPGGSHLKVERIGSIPSVVLSKSAPVHGMRPSVDVLFNSVGRIFKEKIVAIIMTGMGEDGAQGLETIRSFGGHTLAQDRTSSVVFGMPKAAIDRKVIEKVIPLSEIGPYLNSLDLNRGGSHEGQTNER